eukprot:CAMPEP_0170056808 /NCGR_PEP_ID=MMETSP0019_2-20121128/69_1 /TAXON_ID=98059 /ORGANISM="Dinobryon sp., Strain UTEXLB2267" /LENGTH=166 /DNA_ID=CAMNT_0010261395 /DNA_START=318 /DNA_END=818 /DNA_ORIENTATION=+
MGNKIVVLADKNYSSFPAQVDFHHMSLEVKSFLTSSAMEFAEHYEHYSTNAFRFELSAMQRYFVFATYMNFHNIPRAFLSDSDMYLLTNVTDEFRCFPGCDLVHSGSSLHNSYWTRPLLNDFIDFIRNSYVDPERKKAARLVFEDIRKHGHTGGICDMTLIHWFAK